MRPNLFVGFFDFASLLMLLRKWKGEGIRTVGLATQVENLKLIGILFFTAFFFVATNRRFCDISILKNLTLRFGKFAHAIPSHSEKIKEVAQINKRQFHHLLLTTALL